MAEIEDRFVVNPNILRYIRNNLITELESIIELF